MSPISDEGKVQFGETNIPNRMPSYVKEMANYKQKRAQTRDAVKRVKKRNVNTMMLSRDTKDENIYTNVNRISVMSDHHGVIVPIQSEHDARRGSQHSKRLPSIGKERSVIHSTMGKR
jgi:hypothetical protein